MLNESTNTYLRKLNNEIDKNTKDSYTGITVTINTSGKKYLNLTETDISILCAYEYGSGYVVTKNIPFSNSTGNLDVNIISNETYLKRSLSKGEPLPVWIL